MVGQRFVSLLADHPWFDVTLVAASANSAGKSYEEAVAGRWAVPGGVPGATARLTVEDASDVSRVDAPGGPRLGAACRRSAPSR